MLIYIVYFSFQISCSLHSPLFIDFEICKRFIKMTIKTKNRRLLVLIIRLSLKVLNLVIFFAYYNIFVILIENDTYKRSLVIKEIGKKIIYFGFLMISVKTTQNLFLYGIFLSQLFHLRFSHSKTIKFQVT